MEMKRFRDLPHRSSNEALRVETGLTVKLSETAAEFISKLAAVEEQHAQQLNNVVKTFRRRTNETLRRESVFTSSTQFAAWEALLNETEQEAKCCTDYSQQLLQSVNQQLLELTAKKKQLMKRWFIFREAYMTRVDKTEDHVLKLFRAYQDQWSKYAENLDKTRATGGPDSVKHSVVLHSYNAHNEYVMQLSAFNALHEEFYSKQIYDMLEELQALQEDVVKGFQTCMQKHAQLSQEKANQSLTNLSSFLETLNNTNASADISSFISGQNVSVKIYPPPRCDFRTPELPTPKTPDTTPLDLPSLSDELQLIDMTQAPLMHAQKSLKQKEFDLKSGLDQLQKEYLSVKTLLDSYRENPSMGDPNTLVEELLDMRNRIRVKEAEIVMVRAKLALFTHLSTEDDDYSSLVEDSACMSVSSSGVPRKSSDIFMAGRDHEFAEIERKLPVFCRYCDGMIQPPISRGLKCKVCKTNVHHKCVNYIPYCSGQPPVKNSPKLNIHKRISMILTRKTSNPPGSPESQEEEDETIGGLYEAPIPLPIPPKPSRRQRMESPTHVPKPPPRGESLDTAKYGYLEDVLTHHSFEDSIEFADSYSYCVAMYNYDKINPNDMQLNAGEVIELINTASSDWWKGTSGDKKGYFPASYVQLVSHGDIVMKALYDFSPQGTGEIALLEGQIVVMTRNDGDGWLYGKSGDQEGLFPENYVKKIATLR